MWLLKDPLKALYLYIYMYMSSTPAHSQSLDKVILSARGNFHEKIVPPLCICCSSPERDYTVRKYKVPLQILPSVSVLQP